MKYLLLVFILIIPILSFTQVNKPDQLQRSIDEGIQSPSTVKPTQIKNLAPNVVLFDVNNQLKLSTSITQLLKMEILSNGENVFIGESAGNKTALLAIPMGRSNTFVGTNSGALNFSGYSNTFVGESSGGENEEGFRNSFLGARSGLSNDQGIGNTFLGFQSGVDISNSNSNTFIGSYAGQGRTSGNRNVIIGHSAGSFMESGSGTHNIMIGYEAGSQIVANNKLYIENSSSADPLIYGDFATDELTIHGNIGIKVKKPDSELHLYHSSTNGSGTTGLRLENSGTNNNWWNLYTVNSNGNLALFSKEGGNSSVGSFNNVSGVYTATSDRRVKKNIRNLDDVLYKIKKINAKTYHFKVQSDQDKKSIGLIAQDVLDLFPELVSYDEETDRYSLDYGTFSVIAIKAIQEQQKIIEELLQNQTKILKMLHDKPTYKIKDSE